MESDGTRVGLGVGVGSNEIIEDLELQSSSVYEIISIETGVSN